MKNALKEEEAFLKAVQRIGQTENIGAEYYKTTTRYLSGRPPWQPPRFVPALFWNYLKISLRKIKRQKGHSFINIVGLATGIACCVFILLFIRMELSYDKYHPDVNRIFRVGLIRKTENGKSAQASNIIPMGPALKASFPWVEYSGRAMLSFREPVVKYKDKIFIEEYIFKVDPEFFNIFHIPFVQGDPKTALNNPNTTVVSEDIAQKYFNEENHPVQFTGVYDHRGN